MTALITKGGEYMEPEPAQVIKWVQLYPDVDCYAEINSMAGWLDANSSKRKTLKGMPRFINAWLSRAQSTQGSPAVKAKKADREARGIIATRDMTHEQMMSRDWAY